jgi:hypothetical protein
MADTPTTHVSGFLERTGLFSAEQIAGLMDVARREDGSMADIVVREGYAREDEFLKALGEVLNLSFERFGPDSVDRDVLERLPTKVVFQYNVMPIALEDGALIVASNDPFCSTRFGSPPGPG